MFKLISVFLFTSTFSFGQERVMYRITDSEDYEDCGYVDETGDTLVPLGECIICFTDSLSYAIVIKKDDKGGAGFLAIDSHGNEVFRVFPYDNGPDYVEDGTFRIIEDGKIGYVDEKSGEIIIEPTYEAAWPFENGRAKVSIHATKESDGEHSWWMDTDWFYIDKNGNRHENQSSEE